MNMVRKILMLSVLAGIAGIAHAATSLEEQILDRIKSSQSACVGDAQICRNDDCYGIFLVDRTCDSEQADKVAVAIDSLVELFVTNGHAMNAVYVCSDDKTTVSSMLHEKNAACLREKSKGRFDFEMHDCFESFDAALAESIILSKNWLGIAHCQPAVFAKQCHINQFVDAHIRKKRSFIVLLESDQKRDLFRQRFELFELFNFKLATALPNDPV